MVAFWGNVSRAPCNMHSASCNIQDTLGTRQQAARYAVYDKQHVYVKYGDGHLNMYCSGLDLCVAAVAVNSPNECIVSV